MAQAIELKGEEIFRAEQAEVFGIMSDVRVLARSIPNAENVQVEDEKTVTCVVRPGFSFVRGKLHTRIEIVERIPNDKIVQKMTASGIGLAIETETKLVLLPEAEGGATRLIWRCNIVKRTGLISMVPAGVIQGAAEKTIADGWVELRKHVEK
jgi:carbon monoxide dehydrogenase subunit G